jgi:hypothetical protein
VLGRVRDSVTASGAELVVVAAPSFYQLDATAWRQLVGGAGDRDRYDQEAPNRHLAGIAQRQRLRFLDLLPAVRQAQTQAQATGGSLYYPADGHWTTEGHAFAARQIADYLASAGLTPRP